MRQFAAIPIALALSIIAASLTLGFIAGIFGLYGWIAGRPISESNLVDYLIFRELTGRQYFLLLPSLVIGICSFRTLQIYVKNIQFPYIIIKYIETRLGRAIAIISLFWFFTWSIFCYFRLDQTHLFLPCNFVCQDSWGISEWVMYFGVLVGFPSALIVSDKLVNWIQAGK